MVGNTDGKAYGLNANELCVFEAIGRCSRGDNARGWYASMQALADAMPFVVSKPTVLRAVDKLLEQGLIVRREDMSLFVVQNEPSLVQNEPSLVQNEPISVQNEPKSTPLNNPPININNNKQNDKTKTPAPTRKEVTELKMKNNFDIFWAYHNPPKNLRYNKRQCRWLWEDVLDYSVRDQIIDQLMHLAADNRLADERNPYYYLRSFAPREPHNWNGDPSIDSKTRTRLLSAKYHDQFGMYTVEHVLLFGLPVAPDARPLLDAYIAYYHNNHDKKPVTYKVL